MPTGYTSQIENGISFQDFVLNCARAFGALITMRDEPANAQIPEKFEPSDYHVKQLVEAKKEFERLETMNIEQARSETVAEYEKNLIDIAEYRKKKAALRSKYEDMLAQVRRWNPPTSDHVELKNFMIQQIISSIDFDCSMRHYDNNPPQMLPAEDWLRKERKKAADNISYHTKKMEAETTRAEECTRWVQQLRASLV
jgi:hypothetical protein